MLDRERSSAGLSRHRGHVMSDLIALSPEARTKVRAITYAAILLAVALAIAATKKVLAGD